MSCMVSDFMLYVSVAIKTLSRLKLILFLSVPFVLHHSLVRKNFYLLYFPICLLLPCQLTSLLPFCVIG